MGTLSAIRDFLLFKDLPANRPTGLRASGLTPMRSLSGQIPGWQIGKPTWPSDNVLVMTREGYRKCVTAFACINIIADAVAEATLRVWEDQGAGKREEIVDHPLRQLLQHPNPRYSEAEFLALTIRIAAISGYCVIEKIRSRAGNVVQLGHLRSDYLKPILRDQALPDWEYTIPGERPEILEAKDAVVFTYLDSPFMDVTGDTPMRAVLRQAGISNELTDFVKLLLERGGMPQIVLVVDTPEAGEVPQTLTDDEREAIRQQFMAKYGGARNWGGPAILEGMKVETVSFNLNEMAFKDLRDGIDVEVCRAWRVPAPVVQVMAGLTTSYGKTLEESMTLLQMYTATPIRTRLDGALTRQLLPEFETGPSRDLGFDTSGVKALQEDEDAVHTRARENLRAGGITLDEFRQHVGEEPLENDLGRSLMLPYSVLLTPVDGPVAIPAKTTSPDPEEEEEDGERSIVYAAFTEIGGTAHGANTYMVPANTYVKTGELKRIAPRKYATPEQRAAGQQVAQKAKRTIVQLAKAGEPTARAFLDGQRDRILEALVGQARGDTLVSPSRERDHKGPDFATRAIEAIDWLSEDEFLREAFRGWWEQVTGEAFTDISQLIGTDIDWNLSNPQLQDLFDVLGHKITRINAETRQAVETVVRESLIEGTTIDDLAANLRDLFDETYANRHVTVARTESQIAYNLASQKAYQVSGVVEEVMMHDGEECEAKAGSDGLTCPQRNGMIVPVGAMGNHIDGEHPNGTLAFSPVVTPLEGDA